ncbi:MAG: hypothetical protein IT528_06710 [Nitrosomonas sp.]|nr:hypothetical protein [Nitrosomonas sp.]
MANYQVRRQWPMPSINDLAEIIHKRHQRRLSAEQSFARRKVVLEQPDEVEPVNCDRNRLIVSAYALTQSLLFLFVVCYRRYLQQDN